MFLRGVIQYCKRVWNGFINLFTFKKSENSVASTNPSASSVISNQSEHELNLVKLDLSNLEMKLDLPKLDFSNLVTMEPTPPDKNVRKILEEFSSSKDIDKDLLQMNLTKFNDTRIIIIPEEMQRQQEDELHRFVSLENISSDDVNELESLLKKGLNPNVKDEKDNTPLHKAVSVMIKISDELSNIISNGIKGDKALLVLKQQCRLSRSADIMCLLLDYKADLFIKNKEDKTPIDLILKSDLAQQLYEHNREIFNRIGEKTKAQNYNNHGESNANEQLSRCFALESSEPASALEVQENTSVVTNHRQ